jgi:hypothetical protein
MTNTNNPPSPIEFAQSVIDELATFLANHPVIESENDARAAKVHIDRARAAFVDIEAERVKMVTPLNDEVARINAEHKRYHNNDKHKPGLFDKLLMALVARVQSFMLIEEARRKREAEHARLLAEAAEKAAREAEAREKEVHENAAVGEVGLDIQEATTEADVAFSDFQRASRFAAHAEKASKVKIGGGFGRSLSIKDKEVLIVKDWKLAIDKVGLTDNISDAILTAARNYRQEYGELPPGIEITYERKV